MAARFYLFGLIIPAILSLGCAQDPDGHAQPLFEYETRSLTEKGLETLLDEAGASDKAHLFAFDDGAEASSLGGALINTVPIAAPCYRNLGVYDAEKCAAVRTSFRNPYLHENDPTSIFWPLYQGRTCMPTDDPNSGNCTRGGFPVYAVNVSNVGQIQLAVNFARNANLRLVIKNTGHCYLGKSSGAGALSIWTHNLKNLEYYPHLEIPGYSGPAMKVGAGVTVREVYAEADRNDVSALGGICESVGYAGGYIAGGGHTPLSGLYGMAADHVMALEVVTADGRFITASPSENTDLTSPTVPASAFWEAMYTYFSLFIPFTDAGTYSWFTLTSDGAGSHTFSMDSFFAPNHTLASFSTLTKPLFDRLHDLNIPLTALTTTAHPAFYPAYNATWGSNTPLNSAGGVSVPGNRLLPRRNWEDPARFNATFAVLRRHAEAGRRLMGYHQAPRNRANADNAVNSAFREVVAPESEGGGAYLNEANVDEPEWQSAFYGVHYGRLLEIKRERDPRGVFYATTAVGSEGWEIRDGERGVQTQDGRLCRV
ncbi:6-hydroxy-D-nicotine oxidase [Parachaetomium inaequale]|uniref:6-hydroxy-D-nicotine oxidase n=1 Tax=Parachaetomium inaequale TaxID=2588326 RepID=A0AAN6SMR6_9PEZI|nr:6-hydroxy-D-nicotine oxidase [Parachaetomium inaequale]